MPDTLGTLKKTDTAADHMTMSKRAAAGASTDLDGFSRVAVGSEEWSISDSGGVLYKIKFDNNFAKKHLFTYTKKKANTEEIEKQVAEKVKAGDKRTPEMIREEANEHYLMEKIKKNLNNRSVAATCTHCSHDRGAHYTKSGVNPAADGCKECLKAGKTKATSCKTFDTDYNIKRKAKLGAGSFNPLAGAPTPVNGCIVMNKVPKGDFDKALVSGIKAGTAHGKPGQTLVKLDFGATRKGSVIKIDATDASKPPVTTNYQGCYLLAEKGSASTAKNQIWTILHMETGKGDAYGVF